jgi:hypothetical protein
MRGTDSARINRRQFALAQPAEADIWLANLQ